MRSYLKVVVFALLFVLPGIAFGLSPQVDNGLSWLSANQNSDGSWGSSEALPILNTTIVVDTLSLFGATSTSYSNGISWLATQQYSTLDLISRKIVSMKKAGLETSDDLLVLLNSRNSDGGWGAGEGFMSTIIDTALALQALKAVNYSDQNIINGGLSYLLSTQNADGGWGFYQGDSTNVYMTGIVLETLSGFKKIYNLTEPIGKAVAYLFSEQDIDGGIGTNESTVYETAAAYNALVASGADLTAIAPNVINYLVSTQLANGSWENDPYSTALALRCLGNTKANLAIDYSDISFSNSDPVMGDSITISANVRNSGTAQAENVAVYFYSGDPSSGGTFIGETVIPSIPSFGAVQTDIFWTIPGAFTSEIFVIADPLNTISELDETDNIASRVLTSATLPDLSVTSADIAFNPVLPLHGDTVTISITVRNKGEAAANNVTVDAYDGSPADGGVNIGSTTIATIAGGGSVTAQLTSTFIGGNYNIHVVADRTNIIMEGSESNNTAVGVLSVQGGDIDLSIEKADIFFSPVSPTEGDQVVINALVRNKGEGTASNVGVEFYLGDPQGGGTLIGSGLTISAISARGTANVSSTWNTTGHTGNRDIYVKADPLDLIPEATKLNNKAYRTIRIGAKTGPDLSITASDIQITPIKPNTGDTVTIRATIRNFGTLDASNVAVDFTLGDPETGGTLILATVTAPSILKGSSALVQTTWNTTGYTGSYDVYANVDPFNTIVEMDEKNNIAHQTVSVKGPEGPDLTVEAIDTSLMTTDNQTLGIAGSTRVTIRNSGNNVTTVPFVIMVFDDKNKDKIFSFGTDAVLGTTTYNSPLAAGASWTVDIPVSGNVPFKDNLLYVMVDSNNTVVELDETNNIRSTGQQCEYKPPVGIFSPVEKWKWTGSTVLPSYKQVVHTPVVARIIDTNRDGIINEKDIPAIIFNTYAGQMCHENGVLRAIRGDNGAEIFSISNAAYRVIPASQIAVGDIDNDGLVEIVCAKSGGGTIVFENNGTFKWSNPEPSINEYPTGSPFISDIDNDGKPEIVNGATVFNNNGTLRWRGTAGIGSNNGVGRLSMAADINMDGIPEIVAGNTAYKNDGSILWNNTSLTDGYNAIGNFNDDPYPEIVLVTRPNNPRIGAVYLLNHEGQVIWGPSYIPGSGLGGPPVVADFDGDGKLEIGVAGAYRYVVFRSNGTQLWSSVTQDVSSSVTGSSVFDFEGDGKSEVIYNDEKYLRVYDGRTGKVLVQIENSSRTSTEYPVIVDVDLDNRAEMVVIANSDVLGSQNGIRVFEDANDNWVNTRKIWNQHTYHITNINDDGTVPRIEQNNWEIYNNYRCNVLTQGNVLGTSDLTASFISMDTTNYPGQVTVTARIGNGGGAGQVAGVEVDFFDGNPVAGGILIGTKKTSSVLEPGAYEDVSVVWQNPSQGIHNIFVVADRFNKINECREANNTANASFTLGEIEPTRKPDLSVSPNDITIIPSGPVESQPLQIKAVIHNIGSVGASNIHVSFFDGDPLAGGVLIASQVIPFIEAGVTALVETSWNTYGQAGQNYIHIVVDPQNLVTQLNEDNNATLLPVVITPPSKPDLVVTSSDITFPNTNVKEGDIIDINVMIHNFGVETSGVEVYLYDDDPLTGANIVATTVIPQIIPFGGKVSLNFTVNTIGLAGNRSFRISVDPNNLIDEINEANNAARVPIAISSANLGLSLSTDKSLYTANENVGITININNLINTSREGMLEVLIQDLNANTAATVANGQLVTLSSGENKILNYTWNTGATFTGNYKVFVRFYEAGITIADAKTPFTIAETKTLTSRVVTDKMSYNANEQVGITSTAMSASANTILYNLTARITVAASGGTTVFTDTKAIPILGPGARIDLSSYWNTGTSLNGPYAVTLEVLDGVTLLSTSQAQFIILGSSQTAAGITGTISATPNPVFQGLTETITYTALNNGNENVTGTIKILIINPDIQAVKQTFEVSTTLGVGASYTGNFPFSTLSLEPHIYLAVLQVVPSTMTQPRTIASTAFEVKPGVEITKTISDSANLLVWSNKTCSPLEPNQCIRTGLLAQIFTEAGVSYHIVYSKGDFETEMRNPVYTDFIILGHDAPLTDHHAEELREQVHSDKGLISSLYVGQSLSGNEVPLLGLKYYGRLSGSMHNVAIPDGILCSTTTLTAPGDAFRVEADYPVNIMAWINTSTQYPGIIGNQYGNGKTLFFAFDVGETLSDNTYFTLSTILKNALSYVHTPTSTTALYPDRFVPLTITLQNFGGAANLTITETYPQEIKLYDPLAGQWLADNPWTFDVHVNAGETKQIVYYAMTPDQTGAYALSTDVQYVTTTGPLPYRSLGITLTVAHNTTVLTQNIITALNALAVTGNDRTKVNNVIKRIGDVQARGGNSLSDIEKNIFDICKAVEFLLDVENVDTAGIRLMIDELLKTWEGKWTWW